MATPQVISVPAAQQPMIIQQIPAQQPTSTYNINVRAIKTLGIISTGIAVLLIALGIAQAALAAEHGQFSTASGIWCGLFVLLAGILGLNLASHPQSGCLLGCNMTFNIIAMVIFSFAYGTTGVGIALWSHRYEKYDRNWDNQYDEYYASAHFYSNIRSGAVAGIAVNSTVVILLCIEWVVALITAIFCCMGCCCRPHVGVVIQQAQPMYVVGGVQTSYGQPMVAYGQQTDPYGQPVQYGQPMVGQYYVQQAAPPGYAVQGGVAASGSADIHAQPLAGGNATNAAYSSEQKEGLPPAYQA